MKFQPDRSNAPTITGFGPGWFSVNADRYTHSLVLSSDGAREPWNCQRFDDLTAAHFEQLARHPAEVVLFGSGARLRFIPPAWLRPLAERGLGLETMDTAAAFRTFNVLAGEGRTVVAALLLEDSPPR